MGSIGRSDQTEQQGRGLVGRFSISVRCRSTTRFIPLTPFRLPPLATINGAMTVLDQLRPDDLLGAWKYVHLLEELGEIGVEEAGTWKRGVYRLMARWDLAPDDLAMSVGIDCVFR